MPLMAKPEELDLEWWKMSLELKDEDWNSFILRNQGNFGSEKEIGILVSSIWVSQLEEEEISLVPFVMERHG